MSKPDYMENVVRVGPYEISDNIHVQEMNSRLWFAQWNREWLEAMDADDYDLMDVLFKRAKARRDERLGVVN